MVKQPIAPRATDAEVALPWAEGPGAPHCPYERLGRAFPGANTSSGQFVGNMFARKMIRYACTHGKSLMTFNDEFYQRQDDEQVARVKRGFQLLALCRLHQEIDHHHPLCNPSYTSAGIPRKVGADHE